MSLLICAMSSQLTTAPVKTIENGNEPLKSDKRLEKTTINAPDASEYPEGGTKAWLTVIGTFCVFIITFGWLQSAGTATIQS